jgi:hypothetical protein
MPGAGKSTVTDRVGRLLPQAAQVKGDDVNLMILSGHVGFLGTPRDEALRQYELCKRNMCALANNFIDFGFTVLMDTVVQDRAMLDLLLALMSPRPVRLVILAPGIEVCRRRNAGRLSHEQFDFEGYDILEADMKHHLGSIAWWFDTSALTPEQTAEQVVREAAVRAAPLQGEWNAQVDHMHTALTASDRSRR